MYCRPAGKIQMLNVVSETPGRNQQAAEYLGLLHSLSSELEHAIEAITTNSVVDLEESIANQYLLSARIISASHDLHQPVQLAAGASQGTSDNVMDQIHSAARRLQTLQQHYSAVLQYSSRSVSLMIVLFKSIQGEYQETNSGMKQQTWSCEI